MARKIISLVALLVLSLGAFAQSKPSGNKRDTLAVKSERLYLDVAFDFDFDNTEYAGSGIGPSETLFGATLAPALRYEWHEKHSLVAGVNMQKMFGSTRFLDNIGLIAYYQFSGDKDRVMAGLFRREMLKGDYSEAFFSNVWLASNRLVQGLAYQYTYERGVMEIAVDWNGMISPERREEFRILYSNRTDISKVFYGGVALDVHHYANRSTFVAGVVDDIKLNPYLGVKFNAFFDFDFRLGYLLSVQRDRMSASGWKKPMGGEFLFRMSRWGAFISNNIYVGENLLPLYNLVGKEGTMYGADLYATDPFYGTTSYIYNRTAIGYERDFLKDRLKVKAEVVLKTEGKRVYTQQIISLGVNIAPKLYDKNKKRNR